MVAANGAGLLWGETDWRFATRPQQIEKRHVSAERPAYVMVLAVHVVGDCPSNADEAGARRHRQKMAE